MSSVGLVNPSPNFLPCFHGWEGYDPTLGTGSVVIPNPEVSVRSSAVVTKVTNEQMPVVHCVNLKTNYERLKYEVGTT